MGQHDDGFAANVKTKLLLQFYEPGKDDINTLSCKEVFKNLCAKGKEMGRIEALF